MSVRKTVLVASTAFSTLLAASVSTLSLARDSNSIDVRSGSTRIQAPAGSAIFLNRKGHGFGSETTTMILGTGTAANSPLMTEVMKRAAESAAAESAATQASPRQSSASLPYQRPERPEMQAIQEGSALIGGLTELSPGSGVLITARHVLQGTRLDAIDAALRAFPQGQGLDGYLVHEFIDPSGNPVDAVAFVPLKKGKAQGFTLSKFRHHDPVRDGDFYWAYQFGLSQQKSKSLASARQISYGVIMKVQVDGSRYFLGESAQNTSTFASSGSLLFGRSGDAGASRGGWRPSGILECFQPGIEVGGRKTGVEIKGGIRVIPFSYLKTLKTRHYPIEKIASEPRMNDGKSEGHCTPLDGRGGGGDRIGKKGQQAP